MAVGRRVLVCDEGCEDEAAWTSVELPFHARLLVSAPGPAWLVVGGDGPFAYCREPCASPEGWSLGLFEADVVAAAFSPGGLLHAVLKETREQGREDEAPRYSYATAKLRCLAPP